MSYCLFLLHPGCLSTISLLINLLSEIVVSFSPNDLIVIVGGSEDWIYILEKIAEYGHEIEMYTVEQGEKRDKRQ